MKQSNSLWQASGFALTTLLGALLHFLYVWTGESTLTAPFSAINESTWEHMKLLFWPLFLFSLVQRPFYRDQRNYWCVKLAEILLGLALIPVLFYTYNGILGKSPSWVDISIFFVAAAGAFLLEWWLFRQNWPKCRHPWLALAGIFLLGILFVVFTFAPPPIPLFADPLIQ